jgi:hypothetical protein
LSEMINLIADAASNKSKRLSKINMCHKQYLSGDARKISARNP